MRETTALGAALAGKRLVECLAGLAVGAWKSIEEFHNASGQVVFKPNVIVLH